ncbi:L-serine ammonia-lyase, iron-sulfur-dependent, subunit alpha [Pseudodesulfovibrio sp.]|uniref:L-cysteine desulfidase family protein n=1 Tax=Pseudodesulfovibrio sp. TaxID=2035812 RepID=UPI00262098B7|nr:L-serine ammonia-lyase, iron-sulfur-dependent, subunit alpha [Pseudodesulfovibrio sp.]MDD3312593.1 L-serine ammonia-lyase, iron-sulfur-dependent, subunit alpha [Pseudodesulfovibrio sp.]
MMPIDQETIEKVLRILNEEIVPAQGCTEPIAIALVAAKVREVLGELPERVKIFVSGNIIKNVKSVVVPNSGGMIGIEAAAAMGLVAGDCKKDLMVISEVTGQDMVAVREYLEKASFEIIHENTPVKLYVRIEASSGDKSALVEIQYLHTNLTRVVRDGQVLLDRGFSPENFNTTQEDRSILSVRLIYDLAKSIDLALIRPLFEQVIELNSAIADEGLRNTYGVNIGSSIVKNIEQGIYGDDIRNRCASYAAAGSDARMSGCPLPVMTTSGSGNQGMTASLPVIKCARMKGFSDERLIRALFLSHLCTVHIKTQVGRLSAYCGAMCAAAGVSGAITFLLGGDYATVAHAIINTLGNISGVICDGAKPSCAMKIATGIYAAFDSATLAACHKDLHGGDGIVGSDVEATIRNIGELASAGMKQTDEIILKIMTS